MVGEVRSLRLVCSCGVTAEASLRHAVTIGWRPFRDRWRCPKCRAIASFVDKRLARVRARLREEFERALEERFGPSQALEWAEPEPPDQHEDLALDRLAKAIRARIPGVRRPADVAELLADAVEAHVRRRGVIGTRTSIQEGV